MNAIVQRYLLKYPGRVLILVLLASLIFHTTINVFRLQWSASWLTTPISGGLEKWEKELDGGLGILEFPAPRGICFKICYSFKPVLSENGGRVGE